jgi:hypothetical protein
VSLPWAIVTGRGCFRATMPHDHYKTVAPGGYTIGIWGWGWYPSRVIVHKRTRVDLETMTAFYEEVGEERDCWNGGNGFSVAWP